ncbi:hypothetical protein SUDANB19_06618 [Streptomyces sp. enrichment culture]
MPLERGQPCGGLILFILTRCAGCPGRGQPGHPGWCGVVRESRCRGSTPALGGIRPQRQIGFPAVGRDAVRGLVTEPPFFVSTSGTGCTASLAADGTAFDAPSKPARPAAPAAHSRQGPAERWHSRGVSRCALTGARERAPGRDGRRRAVVSLPGVAQRSWAGGSSWPSLKGAGIEGAGVWGGAGGLWRPRSSRWRRQGGELPPRPVPRVPRTPVPAARCGQLGRPVRARRAQAWCSRSAGCGASCGVRRPRPGPAPSCHTVASCKDDRSYRRDTCGKGWPVVNGCTVTGGKWFSGYDGLGPHPCQQAGHRPRRPSQGRLVLRRPHMNPGPAPVPQRHGPPPAAGWFRRQQPLHGRQSPRGVDAVQPGLPLHLRRGLGAREAPCELAITKAEKNRLTSELKALQVVRSGPCPRPAAGIGPSGTPGAFTAAVWVPYQQRSTEHEQAHPPWPSWASPPL